MYTGRQSRSLFSVQSVSRAISTRDKAHFGFLNFMLPVALLSSTQPSMAQTLSKGSLPSQTVTFDRDVVETTTSMLRATVTVSRLNSATTFAPTFPDSLRSALEIAALRPAEFIERLRENQLAVQTAALIIVAKRGERVFSTLFSQDAATQQALLVNGKLSDLGKNSHEILLRAAEQAIGVRPTVTIFGSGDIRGVAKGETSDEATAGTGNLGMRVEMSKWITTAQATIASTVDTVTEGFGATMLNPGVGRPLRSGLIDYRLFDLFLRRGGIHAYVSFANANWMLSETLTTQALTTGIGLLSFYNITRGKLGDSDVSLNIELGVSSRILTGDVTKFDEERKVALGTERTFFPGFEFGFQLGFGAITGAVQFYLFPAKEEDRVLGLTDGQVTVAFNVVGEIVRDTLK